MLELLPVVRPAVRGKEGQLVPSRENEVRLKVICGANIQELEGMSGYTIGEVKYAMREIFNIGNDHSITLVNGRRIEDMNIFLDGSEEVEFKRPAGQKGL